MHYKEAMSISSVVDGAIKCTYAMLYDKEGNRVFCLQNKNFGKTIVDINRHFYEDAEPKDVDEIMPQGEYDSLKLSILSTASGVKEPVCVAKRYVDGYRVPVILTTPVEKLFERVVAAAERYHERKQDKESEYLLNRRKQQLADIRSGKEFYVKVKTMEWHPTNIINLSSDLVKKSQALKKAKNIMAVSSAVTIF